MGPIQEVPAGACVWRAPGRCNLLPAADRLDEPFLHLTHTPNNNNNNNNNDLWVISQKWLSDKPSLFNQAVVVNLEEETEYV